MLFLMEAFGTFALYCAFFALVVYLLTTWDEVKKMPKEEPIPYEPAVLPEKWKKYEPYDKKEEPTIRFIASTPEKLKPIIMAGGVGVALVLSGKSASCFLQEADFFYNNNNKFTLECL